MKEQKGEGKLFGEYMEELGLCTAAQVERAMGYCQGCAKCGRYISIGQALVEMGYATRERIEQVLKVQAKERGLTPSSEGPQ